jgi:hypothetical protein
MTFDNILNLLDPAEKQTLESIVAKRPELKQGWLRQDDYSRKLDEFKTKENSFTQVQELANQWNTWAENNWNPETNSTKTELALATRIQELEAQGTQMTFDEINKLIVDKGLMSKTDFESVLSQKEKSINDSFQGSAYVAAKLAEISSRHTLEFREPFKATEFLGKVSEYGVSDLDKAHDMFVSEIRNKREEEKMAEKIKQVEAEALARGRQEALENFQASHGMSATPTNDSNNDIGYSLQQKLAGQSNEDAIPEGRSVAQFAEQKYREQQFKSA